jgi:hypothetical protein
MFSFAMPPCCLFHLVGGDVLSSLINQNVLHNEHREDLENIAARRLAAKKSAGAGGEEFEDGKDGDEQMLASDSVDGLRLGVDYV